ncbi:hotdog fold thioesterase [Myceligenerans sp. TRM 65318]|uniref:Hotdog fold thioesterase n=2 Tax=Myceligenerans pegani TaxID=2776917 RepID=A0ABR9N768_9MICO|nr:hotdog fold thioesterase [Myceligenerans sp. TRM 65318]MBE3021158.1 hotdog fold thioesterase [Myceligenerans sp. TRM 65318]
MTDTQPGGAVSNPPGALDMRAMYPGAPEVTVIDKLGIEFTEISAERTAGRMPVEGNTQPAGLLHGGSSAVLAETLASVAAQVHAGAGRQAVGIDLNATHHRGVRSGTVTGVATAIHLGRTTAAYEIVISDERDRRVCTARLTCMIIG